MSDYYDGDEDDDDVPPGGRYEPHEPEDRTQAFIDACRRSVDEIRGHRHELHIKTTCLLELLMCRRRSKMLLIDYRPQLQKSAALCVRLGSFNAVLCEEWHRVLDAAFDVDKHDPDAWLFRGYRTALMAHITVAMMLGQCLGEAESIGTSPDPSPYISGWLCKLYGLGQSDIPF